MRKDRSDCEAAWALDIHEEGSRGRDKGLKLMLARLSGWGGVQEVYSENHFDTGFLIW